LQLDKTAVAQIYDGFWNDTSPTSTDFTVGDDSEINDSGSTYVAYLFAHDDGGFGDDGLQNVVTCGSTAGGKVTLGWEPQWLLYRSSNFTDDWQIVDNMRGLPVGAVAKKLEANTADAEADTSNSITIAADGFTLGAIAGTAIYIAIRRGPMKTPTAGTEVFTPITKTADAPTATLAEIGFQFDAVFNSAVAGTFGGGGYSNKLSSRLTRIGSSSSQAFETFSTDAEATYLFTQWDGETFSVDSGWTATKFIWYFFKRAPRFFDVVCYTGTGSATTISHNLGVVPELIIVKNRSQADAWAVYAGDNTDYLVLNTTAATADLNTYWNDTSPTSTVFTVGTVHNTNASAENYVAYLFASLAGISKVGTYTGNGSSVTVTTGFQPRFILVKRTDSTGNWIVGDSARGLVAGDDPYLLLNSTAAEDTDEDWVDVSATGFTVNETAANANVSTATYLYLAIS
jgi:hypothetical protein